MRIVDANVLLYAVNADARHHELSRKWLTRSLSGATPVGLAWQPLLAFLRIATKPGVFDHPLSTATATELVDSWLGAPAAHVVAPTAQHGRILARLLADAGTGANLVNDAHLAALAIEHRATVITFDRDFDRFPGCSWEPPS